MLGNDVMSTHLQTCYQPQHNLHARVRIGDNIKGWRQSYKKDICKEGQRNDKYLEGESNHGKGPGKVKRPVEGADSVEDKGERVEDDGDRRWVSHGPARRLWTALGR